LSNTNCIRLKNLVTILTPTASKDAVGGPVTTFATLAQPFADVEWKSGSEPTHDTKQTAVNNVIFKIRYRDGLNKKMKITFRSRIFDILTILELDRRHMMSIVTQEVQSTGLVLTHASDWETPTGEAWQTPDGETWQWIF